MTAIDRLDQIEARANARVIDTAQHFSTDAPALVAALRAVLELHDTELINDGDDDEAIICQECGYIYDDEEPCPTVRAIEEALT